MPSRKTTKAAAAIAAALTSISKELIDQFVKESISAEAVRASLPCARASYFGLV